MCVGIETNHTYAHTCTRFVHSGGTLLLPMFSHSDFVNVSFPLSSSSPFETKIKKK